MGDMAEDFRFMNEQKKKRKSHNLTKNLEYLNEISADYEVFNYGYQLNFKTSFGTVAFYPSTNRWVFEDKVTYGTAQSFVNWIKNKEKDN